MILATFDNPFRAWRLIAICCALSILLLPAEASAQNTELGFSIGALLGDDIEINRDFLGDVRANFDNAPIYGGRLGWYGWPLGVEASVTYSPSGLTAAPMPGAGLDSVSILYAEGSALFIVVPGPVAPFVMGGAGVHRFAFDVGGTRITETALGWTWGGGLKINLGPIVVRGDLRDHVTKFDSGDIAALLGASNTFHNWEAAAGIGIRF